MRLGWTEWNYIHPGTGQPLRGSGPDFWEMIRDMGGTVVCNPDSKERVTEAGLRALQDGQDAPWMRGE